MATAGPSVAISNLETRLRVGIWDHERVPQIVSVNLLIAYAALPCSSCLDYRPILEWITGEWPRQPHTPLLETRLRELMGFVFGFDGRIARLDVSLSKPEAFPQARGVGVRMALTRGQYAAAGIGLPERSLAG